jgi:hypothetical protein
MKTFLTSLLPVFLAFVLVIGVTAVQGLWTERWGGRDVAVDLARSGRLLEERFPRQFGDWHLAEELESDPVALAASGAVAHIARSYENSVTGAKISAFVVCATPHNASGHTPDRCYPGAGFEIAETEHRQAIPLVDGRKAETFTGTFRKTGETLRVFWTYGLDNRWVAPQIARIELAGSSAVYKLYAIINETRLTAAQSKMFCADFLSNVLPEFDKALMAESSGSAGDAAAPRAADGPPEEKGDEQKREAKPEAPAPPAAVSARA